MVALRSPEFPSEIARLSEASGVKIRTFDGYLEALRKRRAFFKSMGAVSADHGVFATDTDRLPKAEMDKIFRRALLGDVNIEIKLSHSTEHYMRLSCRSELTRQGISLP